MAFKELKPQDWFEELTQAQEFRRKYGHESDWAEIENWYFNDEPTFKKVPSPNLIQSIGDSILSNLTVPFPSIVVHARREDDIDRAAALQAATRMVFELTKLRQEVEAATLNTYLYGVGILKFGYDSQFGWKPENEAKLSEHPEDRLGFSMSQFDEKARRLEFGSAKPGQPWVRSVLPHDVLVPWGTRMISEAPWVAHRIVRHVDEIKADPKYPPLRDLQGQMSLEDFEDSYRSMGSLWRAGERVPWKTEGRSEAKFVELWEIHDRRTGKLYVVSYGYPKFLRDEPDSLQIGGRLPFVELRFLKHPRSFWTTPDALYLLPHQRELTDITLHSAKQRRISILKFLYQDGALDDDQINSLTSARVGAGVKVNAGHSLSESVAFLTAPPANFPLYQDSQQVRMNARETIGLGQNQTGHYSGGRRSATEASIVEQRASLRLDRRSLCLRDCYIESTELLHSIMFEFWRLPQMVRFIDPRGLEQFMSISGPDLRGEYLYDLEFENRPPTLTEDRKRLSLMAYQAMAQDPYVDQAAIRRNLVRAFEDPWMATIFREALNVQQQQSAGVQMVQGGGGSLGVPQGGPGTGAETGTGSGDPSVGL